MVGSPPPRTKKKKKKEGEEERKKENERGKKGACTIFFLNFGGRFCTKRRCTPTFHSQKGHTFDKSNYRGGGEGLEKATGGSEPRTPPPLAIKGIVRRDVVTFIWQQCTHCLERD